ncbi:DUF411 domain-containing protein [Henriciella mobilis]|uniref:DUF411 domain-containing protein n=1 Tax=Henriciella mobilis TaxID=2305467 RepID=A0A399RAV5_9PROT|nr:DUF411 domain-containing protein [Henriciella mobilis]RIJ15077.1 hypothetical protein D1231_13625 [Henriciella mobilis]RIJ20247.1 hypothetical protein D1227_13435 [Henriciella mobilis]RIJ27107.1 hypothetical protein D1223_14835 [Henriciella mobilis]
MIRFASLALAALMIPLMALAQAATMYKTPWCGCCLGHAKYLEDHGFEVEIVELQPDALNELKAERGIPARQGGCHTLIVEGYVVEGHVPVEAIETLLEERPDITGLSLPGMPAGSPGMGGEKSAPFKIEVIGTPGKIFMEV